MTRAAITKKGAGRQIPTYSGLGVRTFINCQGSYTALGGSLPLTEVLQAMEAAGRQYVALEELYDAAGGWIAARTGAEWGLVTSGSAAALCQVTAACIAGNDPEKIARLPDSSGLPDEVITQPGHRHGFEHAIRMTGARILEAASEVELEGLIGRRTAMLTFLGEAAAFGPMPFRRVAEIGRRHGIPVVVDAAAERPDLPNRYLLDGADAVIYSGGKCLRGPQDSGLVLGRKDLLQAAGLNGAPHMSLGRPMKVSKETLMGLLAALEMWLLRDHEAEWKLWEGMLNHVAGQLSAVPSVESRIVQPSRPSNVAPTLSIRWDPAVVLVANTEVKRLLAEGVPSIEIPLSGDGLSIMPYMMEPGEEEVVAGRLLEILGKAASRSPATPQPQPPAAQVAGRWEVCIRFLRGEARHSLEIQQQGGALSGRHRGGYCEAPLEGVISGNEVLVRSVLAHGASRLLYTFRGRVQGGMAGTVDLGEYGSAEWRAAREDSP
jgi:D-glucosaminate-6-phosphate ammonia-lyase